MSFQFNLSSDEDGDDAVSERIDFPDTKRNNDEAQYKNEEDDDHDEEDGNSDDEEDNFFGFGDGRSTSSSSPHFGSGATTNNLATTSTTQRFVTPDLVQNDLNDDEDDDDDDYDMFMERPIDDSPFASVTAAAAATATSTGSAGLDQKGSSNDDGWEDNEYVNWHEENKSEQDDNDDDGGDSVDWEEGHDNDNDMNIDQLSKEQKEKLQKLGVVTGGHPLKEVTFEFGEGGELKDNNKDDDGSSKMNKKKRVRRFKQLTVSNKTDQLLIDLHRAHRLCLMAHLVHLTRLAQIVDEDHNILESLNAGNEQRQPRSANGSHPMTSTKETNDAWSLVTHLLYSLIPDDLGMILNPNTAQDAAVGTSAPSSSNRIIPTPRQLHSFSTWFFDFVNGYAPRIRSQRQRDVAMGAPNTYGRGRRRQRRRIQNVNNTNADLHSTEQSFVSTSSPSSSCDLHYSPIYVRFRRMVHTLTKSVNSGYILPDDEDDESLIESIDPTTIMTITHLDKTLLYLFMTKFVLGWKRVRLISSIQPMPRHLTMDHPLLTEPSPTSNYYIDLSTNDDDEQQQQQQQKPSSCTMETMKYLFQILHLTCCDTHKTDDTIDNDDKKPAAVPDHEKKKEKRTRRSKRLVNDKNKKEEEEASTYPSKRRKRTNTKKLAEGSNITKKKNEEKPTFAAETGTISSTHSAAQTYEENMLHQTFQHFDYVWIEVLCQQQQTKSMTGRSLKSPGMISITGTEGGETIKVLLSSTPSSTSNKQTNKKWITIDVPHELINQPLLVEDVLTSVKRQRKVDNNNNMSDHMSETNAENSASTKSRGKGMVRRGRGNRRQQQHHSWMPSFRDTGKSSIIITPGTKKNNKWKEDVSFVVAAEMRRIPQQIHNYPQKEEKLQEQQLRLLRGLTLTDVTPRYATKWSQTLLKRGGATTKQQLLKNGGQCVDQWWITCLKTINDQCSYRSLRANSMVAASNESQGRNMIFIDVEEGNDNKNDSCETIGDQVNSIGNNKRTRKNKHGMNDSPSKVDPSVAPVINDSSDDEDDIEDDNLKSNGGSMVINEAIPTSKNAFKNHPIYFLASQLKQHEVLVPKTSRRHVCGMFKGELVYRRCDEAISEAWPERKWLYKGRQVRLNELRHPIKYIKAPKKKRSTGALGFQALSDYGISSKEQQQQESTKTNDHKTKEELERERVMKEIDDQQDDDHAGMIRLYGKWQTNPWKPRYVGPNDPLPINEYRNIELELLNPGLVHLDRVHMAKVAKKLSIPYAPCLIGFDHSQGKPTIRGIVVHEHNASILECAFEEYQSFMLHKEYKQRRDDIYMRWKRLIVGVLTKHRLEQEYGSGDDDYDNEEEKDDDNKKKKKPSIRTKRGKDQKSKSTRKK